MRVPKDQPRGSRSEDHQEEPAARLNDLESGFAAKASSLVTSPSPIWLWHFASSVLAIPGARPTLQNGRRSPHRQTGSGLDSGRRARNRRVRASPHFADSPRSTPLYAALNVSMRFERRKSLISLAPQPGFEPEGRGFESLPACQSFQVVRRFLLGDPQVWNLRADCFRSSEKRERPTTWRCAKSNERDGARRRNSANNGDCHSPA